ncbi:midkine a isoform X2 [Leucoraja erinacea]|uniref:midkine a isoform X2 n=1 Tax=Leucoraja erinaceus TaxID=7782 RepID=UPI00245473A4|nr:midkine a isoform X2 [Leucoraja erinacea]
MHLYLIKRKLKESLSGGGWWEERGYIVCGCESTLGKFSIEEHAVAVGGMQPRVLFSLVFMLMLVLMTGSSDAGRTKKEKGKKSNSACKEWEWGACEPASGDCGTGLREGTCKEIDDTKTVKCKVPCNWKKQFGSDCKYKFGNWGECDTETGLKTRNGTLKKALFNAECEQSVKVTKSCDKSKTKSKGKKGRKGM